MIPRFPPIFPSSPLPLPVKRQPLILPAVSRPLTDRVLEAGVEVVNDVVTLWQEVLGEARQEDGWRAALGSGIKSLLI